MGTEIFYFSGTGNSLAIAKRLSQSLGNSVLTPIAGIWKNDEIISEADTIGIVSPVYYICAPDIVIRFLKKLKIPNVKYCFFALTRGTSIAHGAATQMKNVLKANGFRTDAAWYFTMDQTYLPIYNIRSDKKRKILFSKAYKKVDKAAASIRKGKRHWEFNHSDIAYRITQKIFFKNIHNEDKKFYLNDNCDSCGTCVKVCPVNNIELLDGTPTWLHLCETCQACVHFCPRHAIEMMGTKREKGITEGKRRITHPDIKMSEIINQKKKPAGKAFDK